MAIQDLLGLRLLDSLISILILDIFFLYLIHRFPHVSLMFMIVYIVQLSKWDQLVAEFRFTYKISGLKMILN